MAIIINLLIFSGFNAKPVKSDVIIVLGCQLWGESPSPSLKLRLEKALDVYKEGFADKIIVTGAQGSDEKMAESKLMKSWLIGNGVPESAVFEDNKSTSTYENLKFSKVIMDAQNFKTAIIVTTDFHIYRSLRIARGLKINACGASAPNVPSQRLGCQLRETFAVLRNFITGG